MILYALLCNTFFSIEENFALVMFAVKIKLKKHCSLFEWIFCYPCHYILKCIHLPIFVYCYFFMFLYFLTTI